MTPAMAEAPARRPGTAAAARLVQHLVSGWRCQAINAAIEIGLPEALADGPLTVDALAETLACDGDGLGRLLRALCTLEVCREGSDGRFALAPAGRLLCPDGAGASTSLRALAQWWGGPLWTLWPELPYSVRTGRSAREHRTGQAGYGYLDQGDATARLFHEAQSAMSALVLEDLLKWPGWQGARHLVDVGGGHGQLAVAVLGAWPGMHGTVIDLPHAEAGARQRIDQAGLAPRCVFEPGSFFDRIPAGADRYVLKSILHNWSDERAAAILQQCAAAAPRHGRLLVIERILPQRLRSGRRDEAVARTDLNMLMGLGGRERTLEHYAAVLREAGFEVEGTQALPFEFSLIVATPVPRRSTGAPLTSG